MNYASFQNAKPFLIAWFIFLLIVELIGFGIQQRPGANDFTSFYTAGYQLRTHPTQMYDLARQEQGQHDVPKSGFIAFYHPSYETLLFAPFSLLEYRTAYLSFIAFSALLMMAAFFVARPALSTISPIWQSRWSIMLFLFAPLFVTFAQGQDSMLSLLLYCMTWRQLEADKDLTAGCLLGFAMFKFQFVLPIAVLIIVWRGRRFATGLMIACAGVFLLSVCIVGRTGAADYIHLLFGAVSTINKSALAQKLALDPRTMPNIAGLLYACVRKFITSSSIFNVLSAICSLGVFVWCALAIRRAERRTAFAIAVLCGMLVSYHFCFYDLTLLLLPLALLAGRMNRYILACLFVLPAIVMTLGWNWSFLVAVPILALLTDAIASARKQSLPSETAVPV